MFGEFVKRSLPLTHLLVHGNLIDPGDGKFAFSEREEA
jgi:hypothetical protein